MQNELAINDDLNNPPVEDDWRVRVKRVFELQPDSNLPSHPKLRFVYQCITAAGISGLVIGARIGARIGSVEHIETTQIEVYDNLHSSHRVWQGKVILRSAKNALRYGWRASIFAGLYSVVSVVLSEINTSASGTNFLYAGALTGAIYKSLSGVRFMLVGALVGTGLSLPFAGLAGLAAYISPENKDEMFYGVGDTHDHVYEFCEKQQKKPNSNYEDPLGERNIDVVIKSLQMLEDASKTEGDEEDPLVERNLDEFIKSLQMLEDASKTEGED